MERRFSVEAEIEILKHEISVLKALCKDLRFSMDEQEKKKALDLSEKNELARKTKTVESQELEFCPGNRNNGGHVWETLACSDRHGVGCFRQCAMCFEEKLGSRWYC